MLNANYDKTHSKQCLILSDNSFQTKFLMLSMI